MPRRSLSRLGLFSALPVASGRGLFRHWRNQHRWTTISWDMLLHMVVDKVGVWCPLRDGRSQGQGCGRCECMAVQGEHETGCRQSSKKHCGWRSAFNILISVLIGKAKTGIGPLPEIRTAAFRKSPGLGFMSASECLEVHGYRQNNYSYP